MQTHTHTVILHVHANVTRLSHMSEGQMFLPAVGCLPHPGSPSLVPSSEQSLFPEEQPQEALSSYLGPIVAWVIRWSLLPREESSPLQQIWWTPGQARARGLARCGPDAFPGRTHGTVVDHCYGLGKTGVWVQKEGGVGGEKISWRNWSLGSSEDSCAGPRNS